MINKRLIGTVSESKKYIAGNVALQWCSLAANIAAMGAISSLLGALWYKTADASAFAAAGAAIAAALCIRALCTVGTARLSVLSSRAVKPGGRLVYSTCSIDAEEDGLLIRDFLQNHPEWTLKEEKLILPHEEKSDGAYAALLICA